MLLRPNESAAKSPSQPLSGFERAAWYAPNTLEDACAKLAALRSEKKSVVVLSGGTDLIVDRHLAPIERQHPVDAVLEVTGIADARSIVVKDDALVFGGGVTYWDLRSEPIEKVVPMLSAMAKDVGAVQIQTRGTLAGNIASASPAADGVAALMALDAVVTLQSVRGRREVPLETFFTAYRKTVMAEDELIASIRVRRPATGARVTWRKVGTRLAQAISKVALAAVVETKNGVFTHVRFGIASVAATTHPLLSVREALEGKAVASLDAGALEALVGKALTPIDDVRSTGEYRLHVAKALIRQAVLG